MKNRLLASSMLGLIMTFQATTASAEVIESGAQEERNEASEPNSAQPAQGADDIVVTAQKRAESAQRVPISLQVTTGETIADRNLVTFADLKALTPSVVVVDVGRVFKLSIRGVTSGNNSSLEQSVGIYIDGIYHGRSRAGLGSFFDLERIEVLKGPQSIFFGNSSIAGTFSVISRAPTDHFDGYAQALYGSDEEYGIEAAAGGPLTDTLKVRVAGKASGIGGWMTNVNDRKIPVDNRIAGRVSLLWEPSENFDLTLKAEADRLRQYGTSAAEVVDCPPPPPLTARGFCLNMLSIGQESTLNYVQQVTPNNEIQRVNSQQYTATANYLTGDITLTSVTGFTKLDSVKGLDNDRMPEALLTLSQPEKSKQFSQELRISSESDATLSYIAGLYYQYNHLDAGSHSGFMSQPAPPSIAPLGQRITFGGSTRNYSAFASLSWKASEALKVTAGLRYQRVNKTFQQELLYGPATGEFFAPDTVYTGADRILAEDFARSRGLSAPGFFSFERSDEKFIPSVNIQYTPTPETMFYASYSSGFKAGGFNGLDNTPNRAQTIPFEPESVNAFEVGMKGRFFDNRLRFNLALYRSKYKDLQVSSIVVTGVSNLNLVRNAASQISQGVELEAEWVVTDRLRIGANASYNDSHFGRFPNAAPTALQQLAGLVLQDVAGRRPAFAPEFTASGSVEYTVPVGDYELRAEVNPYYTSKTLYADNLDPEVSGDKYLTIDGHIALAKQDDRWQISVIGRNLTGVRAIVNGSQLSTAPGTRIEYPIRPRSVAVQFRYRM